MNIQLDITIPLLNNFTDIKVSSTVFLHPFYCLEDDILNPLDEEFKDIPLSYVRRLIFNNSISVYRETQALEKSNFLPTEFLYSLRRDYTICLTTLETLKKIKAHSTGSSSRSKRLGDFQVVHSDIFNPIVLQKMLNDYSDCQDEFKDLIKDLKEENNLPKAFSKASKNTNTTYSNRLWWLSENYPLKDAYASSKIYYLDKKYKVGNIMLPEDKYVSKARINY